MLSGYLQGIFVSIEHLPTQGEVLHSWGQRPGLDSAVVWIFVEILRLGCLHFLSWQTPTKGLCKKGGKWLSRNLLGQTEERGRKSQEMWSCPWRWMEKKTNSPHPSPAVKQLVFSLSLWHSLGECQMCTALNPAWTTPHAAKCHIHLLAVCQNFQFPNPPKLLLQYSNCQ